MSLYQLLSDNTESEHKALLQHELVSGLMCPSLDAPKYHSILLAHYYWFLNMELKLTKYLSVRTLNMFGYKFKTPAIQKDIAHLDYPQISLYRSKYQEYFSASEHISWTKTHWYGLVFASEALLINAPDTGHNIVKQLKRNDIINYLNIYGSDTKHQFISTITAIDNQGINITEADQMVRGAQYTFLHFAQWLNTLSSVQEAA
ncbi:MAG: hypothetical protein GJ671_04880 [Alteromonadaceae bacterium]|nr:hypothetical protein [Alteromonadaceae bacterium]